MEGGVMTTGLVKSHCRMVKRQTGWRDGRPLRFKEEEVSRYGPDTVRQVLRRMAATGSLGAASPPISR